ncbi:thiol reductant ABC exporter subunit CydC [Acetobacter orientalis]|uniref:thiol reductant ABC exporter subunit CydC n=1 Tax=Acetobacter orientalis TaxID=146474 RepID=UPI00209F1EDE|nr:thiol reductant ABC exporter subunit CydC [Acetobacter orientalis]MCP1215166.1 thiol reductant ABC exporter subunit CydC [Acetobacter orientalis]MCP1218749.1 thiol reductant ABC exporter subunit CydC [Acetobacter orientalis]
MKILNIPQVFSTKVRWPLIGGIGLACLAALANFGLLFLSGWLLAGAAVAGLGGVAAQRAFNMVLPATGVRFFATLRIVARYAERLITHDAALRIIGQIRAKFYAHIAPLAPAALNTQRSGDLLSRFVADTDRVGQYYTDTVVPYIRALVCGCVFIAIFALFSKAVAFSVGLSFIVCGLFVPYVTGVVSDKILLRATMLQNKLQADLTDTINCLGEYLSLGAAQRQQEHLVHSQTQLTTLQCHLAATQSAAKAITGLCATATSLVVLYYATQGLLNHTLSLPQVPMLVLGCLAAFDVLAPLPAARQSLGAARLAMKRLESACTTPILSAPHTATNTPNAPYTLKLHDISFKYQEEKEWVFNHATLSIQTGERVALVGSSGSGKSSLINLLFGFYPYQNGQASFGGVDLHTMRAETLAGYIAVAGQDFHLFSGTVRDNLLLANARATEQEIWNALETVQLADFIKEIPHGLDTFVGNEGLCLSGGQAKRLSIAQALLRKTPWLILDEPTEGLDAQTEQALLENLMRARPDATFVCLTHRPAVLPFMTRVLQIKDGTFSPLQEEQA